MSQLESKKKLAYNLKRTDVDLHSRCHYQYDFTHRQWLESIDSYSYFGLDDDDIKQTVIDGLVTEFRLALNNVVFVDPAKGKIQ